MMEYCILIMCGFIVIIPPFVLVKTCLDEECWDGAVGYGFMLTIAIIGYIILVAHILRGI